MLQLLTEVSAVFIAPEEKPDVPVETETPFEPIEAPRFTQTLQKELVVFEGSSIMLVCFVVGKPMPTVTWFKVRSNCFNVNFLINYIGNRQLIRIEALRHKNFKNIYLIHHFLPFRRRKKLH